MVLRISALCGHQCIEPEMGGSGSGSTLQKILQGRSIFYQLPYQDMVFLRFCINLSKTLLLDILFRKGMMCNN